MNIPDLSEWRVLVVDDEPDSIEIVQLVLKAASATVYSASNGTEALEVFQQEQPSLVLTDLSMPECDGWQLLRDIRASENGGKSVPVIALTAHAMSGDKDKVVEAGFNGYMTKPLHMMTLISDLKTCLEMNDRQGLVEKE